MIPLDRYDKWSSRLDASARQYLSEMEYRAYQSMPAAQRLSQLRAILEKPIARFTPVNDVFFRARWAEVLHLVHRGKEITLLEVASGDADMIPQMMARAHPHSRYITANMNRMLTARLREKMRDLPIDILVVEEDAARIERYLQPESVDIVAFQHAVNDVIQAILCEREAVDTVSTDWMDILPKMIAMLQKEIAAGTLEQHVKPAFLSLLEGVCQVLKTGGVMVMSHYMFQLDLDWGYPSDLWDNMIPVAREWIKALPGLIEVFFEGFDPHWWMFVQKGDTPAIK
jgi:hypothetical protein